MSVNLEQFCQAIDIIVSERLSNLSFDTTMICTIMDASDKDKGHYIVSDGTIRFDAYTNDTSYKENDQVRVSVLNGNFNERKFIEGPYIGDSSGAPVSYISPLGTALPLEENAITKMGSPQNISSFIIHTNADDEKLLWEVDISNDKKYQTLQENGIYNTITLSADFMTNLGNLSQGNYGLVLDLFIKKDKNSNAYDHRYVTLDSSEMIGNPYSFEIYSHQEKKINIAAFGTISMIRLSAYEGVKFTNDGRLGENRIENPFIDNNNRICESKPINIRNIKLGFGNDLVTITENALQLYTTSPIYYNYINPTNETNEKTLGLLWLNKTDTNEYIGYSDGLIDGEKEYDEIEYRKISYQNSRLTAQMDKVGIADDEMSLTLAANIAEAEPYMIKICDTITTELSQVLQALSRQLMGAPDVLSKLNPLINTWSGDDKDENGNLIYYAPILTSYRDSALQSVNKLVSYYSQILNYGYNKQNQILPNDWNDKYKSLLLKYDGLEPNLYFKESDSISLKNDLRGSVNWEYEKYYQDFVLQVSNAQTEVTAFFKEMENMTAAGTILNGYSGICDMYKSRAQAVLSLINDSLDRIHKIFNANNVNAELGFSEDIVNLMAYKDKNSFKSYKIPEEELAEYDNKYCIYWYHYQPGFNLEYKSGANEDNTEYLYGNFAGANWIRIKEKNNVGRPSQFQIKEDGKKYYVAQPLEEDYTTTLHMDPNTEYEKIKVIMFRNHEMISSNIIDFENLDDVPEDKEVDPSDVLRIEHDVQSQDHYQAYTSAYDLANIADGSKMRQLKCYYDGVLSGDETLVDSWLYWYVPTNATLLTYDKDYLVNTLGFSTDIDQKTEFSLDNYVYFAKKVEAEEMEEDAPTEDENGNSLIKLKDETRIFAYKIKSFYEPSATNNTILVKARLSGHTESVNGEKYFTFSTFGNNGTKYTFAIVPGENRVGYCTEISGNDNSNLNRPGGLNLNLMLKDANDNLMQIVKGVPSEGANSIGHSLNVSMLVPSDRSISNYKEIENSLLWNIYIHDPSWDFNEKIKHFIGILKAEVSLYNDVTDKTVSLQTLYPIAYAANPEYYISGPTTIVYNNQGTVSRLSEAPYKLFKHSEQGDILVTPDDNNSEIIWSIDYYYKNGEKISNKELADDNIYAYMPKLNADNTLTPAPLYFTYEEENGGSTSQQYYPVVKCESVSGAGRTLLWSQPIVIVQNKYASSTLNNWDGSFTIDEANGTLMTTMLGAGKKTANNTFEGVLIGDIQAGANFDPDNASGIGIYGFNDGDQSFHFGTDGTAFLGKAGRGRIVFDGNSGTISSASYQSQRVKNEGGTYDHPGIAGMLIDLDDGIIDMRGTGISGTTYEPKIDKLKEEEYEALWDGGSHPSYKEYSDDFDKDATSTYYKQAHIYLDVKGGTEGNPYNPYFLIHSAQQIDNNKHLMFIGDKEYYLQTDDYKTTEFDCNDGGAAGDGAGFKLDLANSLLDAYKLKITSKNLFLNSTSTPNNNGITPYFIIKHDADLQDNTKPQSSTNKPTEKHYKNLMYVGSDTYYLQSANYIPMSTNKNGHMGQGMRLDLAGNNPKITAYNFDLRAGNVKGGSSKNATVLDTYLGSHEIIITDQGTNDGNPYFQINTVDSNDKTRVKTLVNITQSEQSLQSADYLAPTGGAHGKGMRISLSGKELKAYSGFTLQAYQSETSNNYITIDATAYEYPLLVSGQGQVQNDNGTTSTVKKEFKVNWNGGMEATGATVSGTINATGGNFTGTITVGGTIRGGTIVGSSMFAKSLDIGGYTSESTNLNAGTGNFHVSSDGSFWATEGTIGGWKVTSTPGSQGFSYDNVGYMNSTGLGFGENDKFFVDSDGNLFATSATFDSSLIVKSERGSKDNVLEVTGEGILKTKGKLYVGGNYIYLDSDGKNGYLYTTDKQFYVKNTEWFYVESSYIALDGNIGLGDNKALAELSGVGSILVSGTVYYKSGIKCHDGTQYKDGVNGTITYVSGGLFGGSKKKATFVKGILVNADDIDTGTSDDGSYSLPTLGAKGTVLVSNGTGADWSYLKKKFDLSLSGTIKADKHNYYILDDAAGGSYTPIGDSGTYYTGADTTTVYVYQGDSTKNVYIRTSTLGSGYTLIDTITRYDGMSGKCTRYKAGTTKYYGTYKKADDITITAKKDAYEVTLEGGDTADNAIGIVITDATTTIN